ncbi:MAG TPA: hypothetical protein DCF33_17495 [Saprospirales bacterium]|nr:hypothetical protein [Saprospirales bacterium]
MKRNLFLLSILFFIYGCFTPQYYLDKGEYQSAIAAYGLKFRDQPKKYRSKKDLTGLEFAFNTMQRKDSLELSRLLAENNDANWPQINSLYRNIQLRQQNVEKWQPLRTKKGFEPAFRFVSDVDTLAAQSRQLAAKYLYNQAQTLLSAGEHIAARKAYYLLRELKTNYYPYWENANALMDSAWHMGKVHILIVPESAPGISDASYFWEDLKKNPQLIKNDWLIFYTDPQARQTFTYTLKCMLVSLDIGSGNNTQTTRTETKQVEDGFEETRDSCGRVVSRVQKYRCETSTITTYSCERSGNASVAMELIDCQSGLLLISKTLYGSYNFNETSESSAPSTPTNRDMVNHISNDVEWEIKHVLKKNLMVESH